MFHISTKSQRGLGTVFTQSDHGSTHEVQRGMEKSQHPHRIMSARYVPEGEITLR